jgi:ABC-type bacteriocin/lantibiotic exporter with double-glycine peptidase domain
LLEQSYYLNTVTSLFDHVMELPKEIHEELDCCKFGDLESQGLAVSNAVRTFLFHILPVIFDLLVACIVMCYVSSTTTASDFALTVSILIFFCRHVSFCRLRILLLLPDFTRIEEATFWEAISSRQAEVCPEFLSHSRSMISDAAKKRIGVASCVCFVRAFTTIFWFVLLGIGFILVLPVTSVPCAQNQQSLGRLVALVYYILRLFQPLQSLPDTICDFIRWSIEAYRVAARLDPKAKTLNQQKPNTPIAATGKMNPKLPAYRTSTTGEANPESPVSPIIPEAKSEDETSSLVAGTG